MHHHHQCCLFDLYTQTLGGGVAGAFIMCVIYIKNLRHVVTFFFPFLFNVLYQQAYILLLLSLYGWMNRKSLMMITHTHIHQGN